MRTSVYRLGTLFQLKAVFVDSPRVLQVSNSDHAFVNNGDCVNDLIHPNSPTRPGYPLSDWDLCPGMADATAQSSCSCYGVGFGP